MPTRATRSASNVSQSTHDSSTTSTRGSPPPTLSVFGVHFVQILLAPSAPRPLSKPVVPGAPRPLRYYPACLCFCTHQTLGTACCLRGVAWHPNQHVVALAGYGQDAPVLLYCGEARTDKQAKVRLAGCSHLLLFTFNSWSLV